MKNRFFALFVSICLIFSFSLIPAFAVDVEGSAAVTVKYGNTSAPTLTTVFNRSFPVSSNTVGMEVIASSGITQRTFSISDIDSGAGDLGLSGSVGVYFSYVFQNNSATSWTSSGSGIGGGWTAYYYDQDYTQVKADNVSVAAFDYSTDGKYSTAYRVKVNCNVGAGDTFTRFQLIRPEYDRDYGIVQFSTVRNTLNLIFPSFTVVATETSADLIALENIADQLAESNSIANAMYADIMAALNSIKGDTALIASYMDEALTALESIKTDTGGIYSLCSTYLHYLSTIASNTGSIDAELKAYHQDFMSMMETLQNTVIDESGNIQEKMEEIYNLLIAYLNSQFSAAVNPDLKESTGDTQLDIEIQEGLEQGFQSDLTSSWTDLQLETFALGGGYTSAIAWVSSWFSNFYNAMGDFGMIVMLPLYIGIVTLIAGLARQAIRRAGYRSRGSGGGDKGA